MWAWLTGVGRRAELITTALSRSRNALAGHQGWCGEGSLFLGGLPGKGCGWTQKTTQRILALRRFTSQYGNSMLNILGAVFWSGCTVFPSQQQYLKSPTSPLVYQHLLLSVFSTLAIPVDATLYLTVVLIGISLWLMMLNNFFFAHLQLDYLCCYWMARILT